MLAVLLIFLSFLQFQVDIIIMVLCTRLHVDIGGDQIRMTTKYGTTCITLIAKCILATVVVVSVSTSAVSRPPSMASTSAKVSSS